MTRPWAAKAWLHAIGDCPAGLEPLPSKAVPRLWTSVMEWLPCSPASAGPFSLLTLSCGMGTFEYASKVLIFS